MAYTCCRMQNTLYYPSHRLFRTYSLDKRSQATLAAAAARASIRYNKFNLDNHCSSRQLYLYIRRIQTVVHTTPSGSFKLCAPCKIWIVSDSMSSAASDSRRVWERHQRRAHFGIVECWLILSGPLRDSAELNKTVNPEHGQALSRKGVKMPSPRFRDYECIFNKWCLSPGVDLVPTHYQQKNEKS